MMTLIYQFAATSPQRGHNPDFLETMSASPDGILVPFYLLALQGD